MSEEVYAYLVIGVADYLGDGGFWVVCSYGDEAQAEFHAEALNRKLADYQADEDLAWDWKTEDRFFQGVRSTLDMGFMESTRRHSYRVEKTRLWRHFDEYQEAHGM